MEPRPEEVARYTVEQSGGEYTTNVSDLLGLFGRQQLTDLARREIRDALHSEGVGTDPDLLALERADQVRLFLLAHAPGTEFNQLSTTRPSRRQRLRPRTWKGWTGYGIAALLIVAALAGDSEEPRENRPATETVPTEVDVQQRAALRREREQVRRERAGLRRERAQARREQTRARKARAAARRERERQKELEAQAALPAPQPEPEASCHPSYDPCLDPNATDYDCEDGSGDGPMYTGFVTVKGPDDYDLDSNGDGTGCET